MTKMMIMTTTIMMTKGVVVPAITAVRDAGAAHTKNNTVILGFVNCVLFMHIIMHQGLDT